ncbi:MAG: hypothetical protein K2L49_08795, partial [Muribaculaceae bacterium]|nr:hypothetical protein [Muribaculaceae bacterium]
CGGLRAQYQVNCLSDNGDTMTFRVVGYGKNARKASADAELSVIKALMFYGIPGTQQRVAMVSETESKAMKDHKKFLESFYKADYQHVIIRSVIVRRFSKDENKQKSITLDVTVNIRALRSELERNGLIRKFGL